MIVVNVIQIKSGTTVNVSVSAKIRENMCMKKYFWYPSTCACENGKYLENIIDDTVVTCNEIIESTKTVPTNFNKKETTCKISIFYSPFYSLPFYYW